MRNQLGQTLIEILIALVVAGTIVTAITFSVISSLKNSQFAKNQTSATEYAQQGIEIVNNVKDQDFGTFSNLSGTYCLADSCTGISSVQNDPCGPPGAQCSPNVPLPTPIFIRQVVIQQSAPKCTGPTATTQAGADVNVTVSWNDAQCTGSSYCHQVNNETCITNYADITTP